MQFKYCNLTEAGKLIKNEKVIWENEKARVVEKTTNATRLLYNWKVFIFQ